MPRKPLGTTIEPLPSRNIRRMAGAGGFQSPVPIGQIAAIGLNNNDLAGRWLIIWDVQVYANPAGDISHINFLTFTIMTGITGTAFGTGVGTGACSGAPAPPGLLFNDTPSFYPGNQFFFPELPAQGYQWVHDWPLAAIQPGDSIVVLSDANASQIFSVNYLYEYVDSQPPI